jgi:Tol biopolymer transport system component
LSPDGTRLAFIASKDGVRQLWLRRLDSTTGQPLGGTDGASLPFWSPDGNDIGFFASAQLRRISAAGGAPTTICDMPTGAGVGGAGGRGASWSRNGEVFFSNGIALLSAPSTGGQAKTLLSVNPGNGEVWMRWPSLMPDGRHLLFATLSTDPARNGLFVMDLASRAPRRLLPIFTGAIYAAGRLLYRDERGRLVAATLDPDASGEVGAPVILADAVDGGNPPGRVAFSASTNGRLAFGVVPDAIVETVLVDRRGTVVQHFGTAALPAGEADTHVAMAPSGKVGTLVQNGAVWTLDLNSGRRTPLALPSASYQSAAWSPDGDRLAFMVTLRIGMPESIRITDPTGVPLGNSIKVPSNVSIAVLDQWSPHGLFMHAQSSQARFNLWHSAADGSQEADLVIKANTQVSSGRVSPDGHWIAIASQETVPQNVFVQPYPGLNAKWQVSANGGSDPQWRGDSGELFYRRPDGGIAGVQMKAGGAAPAFGDPVPLFPCGSGLDVAPFISKYAPSPDGLRFLCARNSNTQARPSVSIVLNWTSLLNRR